MKIVFLLSTFATVLLLAADTPVKKSDLPPPVQKSMDKQTAGAIIKRYLKEVENGSIEYEVETTVNNHGRDLSFDASGKLLAIEEEVSIDSLPPAAKTAIDIKAKGGKLAKVEKVTEDAKVSYEASITKAGKHSEFAVSPDGSPVK
jgi:uncharacterized membrane protein YkoI